jgi:hypothetical protein
MPDQFVGFSTTAGRGNRIVLIGRKRLRRWLKLT